MALLGFSFVLLVLFLSVSNLLLCYLCYYTGMVNHIYFGGSRHFSLCSVDLPRVSAVVSAVVAAGSFVHVGCQHGADHAVIRSACLLRHPHNSPSKFLRVFAVASSLAQSPSHVQWAVTQSVPVTFSAGGTSAPIHARYLLRSIAAFQGCAAAVFFNPGAGSLAVARECVRSGLPVFAFQVAAPAPVPSVSGQWVASSFHGFACWQWSAPTQPALF